MEIARPSGLNSPNRNGGRGRLEVFYRDWREEVRQVGLLSRGFSNESGAMCYRNCILASLLHQPVFVNWSTIHITQSCPVFRAGSTCLACELGHFTNEYWLSNLYARLDAHLGMVWTACAAFWDTLSANQQDCVEFLSDLISHISNYTAAQQVKPMFQTVLQYRSRCQNCSYTITSEEDHTWVLGASPLEQKVASIEECIGEYLKPEDIPGYKCGRCKMESTLFRQTFIRDAPEILTVQISRFKVSESSETLRLTSKVALAESLDLTHHLVPQAQRLGETLNYQLTSVIVHRGTTIREGHYLSYVKGPAGSWTSLDDGRAEPRDISDVLDCHDGLVVPYVLIYNRKPVFREVYDSTKFVGQTHSIIESTFSPPTGVKALPSSILSEGFSNKQADPFHAQQHVDSSLHPIETNDGLSELFNGSDSLSDSSSEPSPGVRWEGQPAEIAVRVTMGNMVLTGALKGILQRSRRQRVKRIQGTHTTPTGIVKSSRLPSYANHGRTTSTSSRFSSHENSINIT